MKVREIRTYAAAANWRNYIFLELLTNEGDYVGVGEATLANNLYGVLGAIKDIQKYVVGQDPFDVEKIWRGMHRGPFWRGGAIFNTAISGIDQALWDLIGKSLNVPVYKLIGGRYRDSVRLYANGWFSGVGSPKQYALAARRAIKQGFGALKFDPFGTADTILDQKAADTAVAIVKSVREEVGSEIDLLIEAHGRFTPKTAIRIGKRLEHFDPFWLEEPVPPEDLDGLINVTRSLDTPIASGERVFTRFEYSNLLEKKACDIIQPDVCHVGGISELKKIAAMAEAKDIIVAPHNSNGAVSTSASSHLLTAIPNGLILEYWIDVGWRSKAIKEGENVSKGYITASERPGLGATLDLKEITKHPLGETHIDFFTDYKYH